MVRCTCWLNLLQHCCMMLCTLWMRWWWTDSGRKVHGNKFPRGGQGWGKNVACHISRWRRGGIWAPRGGYRDVSLTGNSPLPTLRACSVNPTNKKIEGGWRGIIKSLWCGINPSHFSPILKMKKVQVWYQLDWKENLYLFDTTHDPGPCQTWIPIPGRPVQKLVLIDSRLCVAR